MMTEHLIYFLQSILYSMYSSQDRHKKIIVALIVDARNVIKSIYYIIVSYTNNIIYGEAQLSSCIVIYT